LWPTTPSDNSVEIKTAIELYQPSKGRRVLMAATSDSDCGAAGSSGFVTILGSTTLVLSHLWHLSIVAVIVSVTHAVCWRNPSLRYHRLCSPSLSSSRCDAASLTHVSPLMTHQGREKRRTM
jgi:hypothetical protein